jgi:hypothetical protein
MVGIFDVLLILCLVKGAAYVVGQFKRRHPEVYTLAE